MEIGEQGGYAFPEPYDGHGIGWCGMTLRDWFAGQSVKAASDMVLSYMPVSNPKFQENVAHHAYSSADAMIAHRNKS